MAQTAFPHAFAAEGEVEAGVVGETIDEYDGEDPPSGKDIRDAVLSEEEMLEHIPLPGVPENERERLKAWLALPKKARVAIRRMHQEWGPHMPNSAMIEILKLATAPKEYIKAAQTFRCKSCDITCNPKQTSKVS